MDEQIPKPASDPDPDALAFLRGGGDMGARTRAFDWSRTPLGPAAGWPQSLKTAVRIMLDSRYAMWLGWGPELTFFYNDAYARMTLGPKHPWALGRPARQVWSEIWGDIGPRAEKVVATGEATWDEGLLLFLERRGQPEETYHTFSYSPLPDDRGRVGGMLCVVTEDTERTIGERRLRTLRELAARTTEEARSIEDACQTAARALGDDPRDLPFVLIYLLDEDARAARLCGAAGLPAGSPAAPPRIDLAAEPTQGSTQGPAQGRWPLRAALDGGAVAIVPDLPARFGPLRCGPWPEPPREAAVVPLARPGQPAPTGFLVLGLSPRLFFDDTYRGFVELVGGHVATAIANARAYEEERRRAEALAELDRQKTAFFSNVSHEFRTPLTLMLGPIEDLLGGGAAELPPPVVEQLQVINRNSLRLLRLVNTLLDFSRIEAGRVQASYQPTDLGALTADLASGFRSACERAGLRLTVDCGTADGDEPVYVDRSMWEKIVLNLLSNAYKFTFEGGITVSLRQAGGAAELRVADTGIGVPPREMPRLFERFHRVQHARGRTHEGSGIGLALVHELVKLHGGTIRAESALGRGTTFSVGVSLGRAHLPAAQIVEGGAPPLPAAGPNPYVEEALRWLPDEAPPDEAPPAAARPPSGSPPGAADAADAAAPADPGAAALPRVLVADDNADMRQYIARLLAGRYAVTTARDGAEALAAAQERPPDLILSDIMMPRLGGFALLQALRADPRTRGVPLILLSARAGEESRVEGMEAGADDYLVKPFGARELLARVSAHLQMARMRREADRRKDVFIATLAHELRNPLAPIRNAVRLVRARAPESAELLWATDVMERQVAQMARLLDDLLDVNRITQNKLELRRELITLAAVVESAVETSRPLIDGARHELSVSLPPEPVYVDGDGVRLAQVLANLLNNAAKYTERGGRIWLTVRAAGGEVLISVRDTGIGVAPEMLPHLFEMFAQAAPAIERAQGGLGIGLSLVKRLVEMHGGAVSVHSEGAGRGCEFLVRLPVAPTAPAPAPPEARRAAPGSRRVLVADDNYDAAESLAMLLDLMGHEVRTAGDGAEAVEIAERFRPDVILLDLGMPRLNGYEACRRIRAQPWGQDVLVVAMTGWGQEEDRRRTQEAGFGLHLVKPVDPAALERVLTEGPAAPGP